MRLHAIAREHHAELQSQWAQTRRDSQTRGAEPCGQGEHEVQMASLEAPRLVLEMGCLRVEC